PPARPHRRRATGRGAGTASAGAVPVRPPDPPARRLPMRHEPHEAAVDVYRFWQEHNGGDRRVAGAPTAR
ncbi:hypothetical protein ACFU7B_26470, partial [Streptomyces sp. NPDC057545]